MPKPRIGRPRQSPPPNTKGLTGGATLPVKFEAETFRNLRLRATYETARMGLRGDQHVVSSQDVVREAVRLYFKKVSPMPDDVVAEAIRSARRG